MNATVQDESMSLYRFQKPALIAGIIGLVVSILGYFISHDQFFRSWLTAWVFVTSLSIGALAILMIQYLTGGVWGVILRRPLEAATRVIPLVAVLFIPILFGMHSIYEWTHEEVVARDALLQKKVPYLNVPAFAIRTAAYFLLWYLAAYLLNRWSNRQDATAHDPSPWRGLKKRHVSAFGLLIMAISLTFASVDWLMSLQPHWFSTMFGISFMIGCILTAFAFATLAAVSMSRVEPLKAIVVPNNFRDLGNLMFAFVMLWAYTGFSEFLLIWYGNIREEVPWHLQRMTNGWGLISVALIVFHFFVPFVLLLLRQVKDRAATLWKVAILILVMRYVHLFWIVAPSHEKNLHIHWLDISLLAGLFGIWFFFFVGQLRKQPLLPMYEPHVREALHHG